MTESTATVPGRTHLPDLLLIPQARFLPVYQATCATVKKLALLLILILFLLEYHQI